MKKKNKKQSNKTGLPPGTLVYLGGDIKEKTRITVFRYNEGGFTEKEIKNISEINSPKDNGEQILWINVDGVYDVELIQKIGQKFNLHHLLLEDIVNPNQRPKTEIYPDIIFTAIKMFYLEKDELVRENVSAILGKKFVITFQEKPGDVFDPIRDRIRNNKGKVRSNSADYLYYALLDSIIDNYFIALEDISEKTDKLESGFAQTPDEENLSSIYKLKKQINFLKKMCWPLREAFNFLLHQDSGLISKEVTYYFRDIYDHVIRVIDIIETNKDNLSGLMDIYLSITGNRMNSIMKVLTMISTIFIPLSFIAGLYGMNFEYMPETKIKIAYFIVLGIMVLIASGMLIFFKKKKWF